MGKKRISLGIILAVLVPLMLLTFMRSAGLGEYEIGHDCFYHVTMADLGPAYCMNKSFPHMTMSLWRDHFSDKELGFHLILGGIRSFQRLINSPTGPPFHFPMFIFQLLMLSALVYTCSYFGMDKLYIYTFAFVLLAPSFVGRIMQLRPHNLSITLMLLSCPLLASIKETKGLWKGVLIGFVFSWSYSNPHFVMLPALVFGGVLFFKDRKLSILIPVSVFIGIVAGYVIHPQFPNTFINWKVQCIDVVLKSLKSSGDIRIGGELSPAPMIWHFVNIGIYICVLLNLSVLLYAFCKDKIKEISLNTIAFIAISTPAAIGIFIAQRSIEYALPFTILATGLAVNDFIRIFPEISSRFLKKKLVIIVASLNPYGK